MDFTWNKREVVVNKIPRPNPRTYTPLIVRPLKLKRHTVYVISRVDVDYLPFLVAKYYLKDMDRFCYVHRCFGDIGKVKHLNPPH